MLFILAMLSVAVAQPRDAGRVQAGEDITAWRALLAESPDDPQALAAFVSEFPSSPLAELAYARLVELDGPKPDASQLVLARLDSSLEGHQQSLSRRPTQVAVATIDLASPSVAPEPSFSLTPSMELGALGAAAGMGFYLGAGVHTRRAGLGARGALSSDATELSTVTQLHPLVLPRLNPYAELTAGLVAQRRVSSPDIAPLLATALGAWAPLGHGFSFNAAAELRLHPTDNLTAFTPRVRLGLSRSF